MTDTTIETVTATETFSSDPDVVTLVHLDERIRTLTQQVESLSTQLAAREAENAQLTANVETLNLSVTHWRVRAIESERKEGDFKEQVAEVATRYGRENNMCSVLDEALEELGLEKIDQTQTYTTTVTATWTVTVTTDDGSEPYGYGSWRPGDLDHNSLSLEGVTLDSVDDDGWEVDD